MNYTIDTDERFSARQRLTYVVLYAEKSDILNIFVTDYMNEGWEPIGGIMVVNFTKPNEEYNNVMFYQAMKRK